MRCYLFRHDLVVPSSLAIVPSIKKHLRRQAGLSCVCDSCDSFSLAALATSCSNASKWAIVVRYVNGVGCGDDGGINNRSKQAEELELSILR